MKLKLSPQLMVILGIGLLGLLIWSLLALLVLPDASRATFLKDLLEILRFLISALVSWLRIDGGLTPSPTP